MKKLSTFFKQLQLSRILTVFFAAVVLLISTACNSGNVQGARPNNPPVQAGGANNPYKSGGDTHTNLNFSTDPKVNTQGKRADLSIFSNQLVANSEDGILYPGAESQIDKREVEKSLPKKTLKDFETAEPGGEIQREENFGDRVKDRLSTLKETFEKASGFIGEDAKEGAASQLK